MRTKLNLVLWFNFNKALGNTLEKTGLNKLGWEESTYCLLSVRCWLEVIT